MSDVELSPDELQALAILVTQRMRDAIEPILERLEDDPRDLFALDQAHTFVIGGTLGMAVELAVDHDMSDDFILRTVLAALPVLRKMANKTAQAKNDLADALEVLAAESSAWLLVMRLGDHDEHAPDAERLFAIAGVGHEDPKLRETTRKWLDGKTEPVP